MKKYFSTMMLLLIAMTSFGQGKPGPASDLTTFGFKGKVMSAVVDTHGTSFTFDRSGNISDKFGEYDPITGRFEWSNIVKRTKNGFIAFCDSYDEYTVTVNKNRVSKIVYDHLSDNKKSVRTYTYNKEGILTGIQEVFTYYEEETIEYGSNVSGVDNYQAEIQRLSQEYQRKLMSGMTPQQAQRWYNNAVKRLENAARGVRVNGYARTKKTKHTKTSKITFSNYVFDDFGNWISRNYYVEKDFSSDESGQQNQTITYDSDFWSQFYWKRLEQEGNLDKIESFYLDPRTSETYKELAAAYWNERILNYVAQDYNNNRDMLCSVSSKSITSPEIKEQALEIVRSDIYNNDVMAERDYYRVSQMKNIRIQNVTVFNYYYQQKIDERSKRLKEDSIASLTNKARQEFDNGHYQQALATSKGILVIDEMNETAKDLCQESSYRVILSKEADNSIRESDYTTFVDEYNTSKHVPEIQNKRALYASSLFNLETSDEELERVNSLPADEPTHKEVNKRYKKWMFRKYRGNFVHVGLGGEFALGGTNTVASGELLLRFGYTANILNVVTGIKYNYLTSTSQMFKNPSEPGKAHFDRQYLSVPFMLRFNLKHGYDGCTYIGLGTDINIASISTMLRDVESVDEKDFGNNKLSFTPRVSFGGRLLGLEIELFAAYDIDNPFNVDFIKAYKLKNGESVKSVCDEKCYKNQIEGNDFSNKFRGGIAFRLWF